VLGVVVRREVENLSWFLKLDRDSALFLRQEEYSKQMVQDNQSANDTEVMRLLLMPDRKQLKISLVRTKKLHNTTEQIRLSKLTHSAYI